MLRPLWTMPLSGHIVSKLNENGFFYWEDLWNPDNRNELKPFVHKILQSCRGFSTRDFQSLQTAPASTSSFEVYMKDTDDIITFSKAIDELFGYGIPTESIVELCGAPGQGKTQICLQLCASVQIPKSLGGLSSAAIYIDTNKNFFFERFKEISLGTVAHCKKVVRKLKLGSSAEEEMKTFTIENIEGNLHVLYINGHIQLLAAVQLLEKMITSSKARLIIIDGFAFPFQEIDSGLQRTSFICRTLGILSQLVSKFKLAVVLTNELTTHISPSGETDFIPALGGSFAQFVSHRLLIGQDSILLSKSPNRPSAAANLKITADGIRDAN